MSLLKNKPVYSQMTDEEVLYAPIEKCMKGAFSYKEPDPEINEFYMRRGKLPKWLVSDDGDLYLTIGRMKTSGSFCAISVPSQKWESYSFWYLRWDNGALVCAGGFFYITRIVPENLKGVERKLKLVAEDMRKKNIIAKALWNFPQWDMEPWLMNIRGLYPTEKQNELLGREKRKRGRPKKKLSEEEISFLKELE